MNGNGYSAYSAASSGSGSARGPPPRATDRNGHQNTIPPISQLSFSALGTDSPGNSKNAQLPPLSNQFPSFSNAGVSTAASRSGASTPHERPGSVQPAAAAAAPPPLSSFSAYAASPHWQQQGNPYYQQAVPSFEQPSALLPPVHVADPAPVGSPRRATDQRTTSLTDKNMVPNAKRRADGKYECPDCAKSYLHLKHLKRHHLRHTGERPYSCSLCHDTFCRSDILKRHFAKCAVRRGNPQNFTHLSNAQAHLKQDATVPAAYRPNWPNPEEASTRSSRSSSIVHRPGSGSDDRRVASGAASAHTANTSVDTSPSSTTGDRRFPYPRDVGASHYDGQQQPPAQQQQQQQQQQPHPYGYYNNFNGEQPAHFYPNGYPNPNRFPPQQSQAYDFGYNGYQFQGNEPVVYNQ